MRKLKKLIIVGIIVYAVAYYFDIDLYSVFSTGKTVAVDAIAKVFPDAKGQFETIDNQISSAIVRNGTAKSINDATQEAIKKTSTFVAEKWIMLKKFLRKHGIDLNSIHLPKAKRASRSGGAYSFNYESVDIKNLSSLRQKFINYSMTLRGTPYVLGSKNPATGLDCSGFVQYAAMNGVNIRLPNTAREQYNATVKISSSDREPGDLLFFRRFGKIDHVGIYLGRYEGSGSLHGREIFINSASEGPRTGVVVSALDEPYWRRHYSSSARFLPSSDEIAQIMAERNEN